MYVSAIVVAAGSGNRFQSRISKPLVKIHLKPIIVYALQALNRCADIEEIIVVANRDNIEGIGACVNRYNIRKVKSILLGGKERKDSVAKGLKEVSQKSGLVLIHDAARPFIDKAIVLKAILVCKRYGAAVVGVPVKATIKIAGSPGRQAARLNVIKRTIDRSNLWEIQTPQVFRKELILEAYRKFAKLKVTDDAMLVEKMGKKVCIVPGSYNNIKITTPEDLIIAKAIARRWKPA